jgi:hypothetical protein
VAISLQTAGTVAAGTTSAAPAYPAGVAAGRLAVLKAVSKLGSTSISVPGTYTQLVQAQGGTGADGIDTGQTRVCIFYLVLAGSESGTVTVGSGLNCIQAVIDIYTATNGFNTASFGASSGADTTHDTSWSATMAATLGFTSGDLLVGVNACCASTSTQASKAVTATGATFGTLANDRAIHSANGNDINFGTFDFPVTAGPASAAAVHTMTTSVNNSGITGIARLVESVPAAVPPVVPTMAPMVAP